MKAKTYLYILLGSVLFIATLMYFRSSTVVHPLVTSKPLVSSLPTEVKVLPVVVAKKSSVESRLRVVLPVGHSVTATADLKPSETGYGVLSVIDENTGVSALQQYEKPRKFLGFPMRGVVSAGYGISSDGRAIKLAVEYTPLRVGPALITGEATRTIGTSSTSWYTGVKAEFPI